MRQEEMLRQIHEEKEKLLKQEDMIRSRQQDRLKQVSCGAASAVGFIPLRSR